MAPGRRRLAAVPLWFLAGVLVTSAVACTSSDWDTSAINRPTTTAPFGRDEAGVRESLGAYLTSVGRDLGEWVPTDDEAECTVDRVVRRLGVDRLLEVGYDPQEPSLALAYTPEEHTAVVNILSGCIDFSEAMVSMLSSYEKLGMPQAACISEGFERLGLTRDLAGSLVDGKEPDPFAESDRFASGLASLAAECLEEEDLQPAAPLPRLPAPENPSTTTSTTTPLYDDGEDLDGIEPGGPLDTIVTTSEPESDDES